MKPYILLVSGPLGSGKTTLVKEFLKREQRLFRTSFDAIKRELSDFDGEKDRMLIKDLLFSLSQPIVDKGLSIIVEGSASIFDEMREHYGSIAKSNSIDFFEVNVEAPLETLQQRLRERVAEGKSLTVSEPEQLLKRYKLYLEKKDLAVPTYDTTTDSPETIYTSICHDVLGR